MPKLGSPLEVIATYNEVYKADIAKAQLISEGIIAEVQNGTIASWSPFLTRALGGISLSVRSQDVTRAKKILNIK